MKITSNKIFSIIFGFRSFAGYVYNQHRALCQIQIIHKTIKETLLYFQSD